MPEQADFATAFKGLAFLLAGYTSVRYSGSPAAGKSAEALPGLCEGAAPTLFAFVEVAPVPCQAAEMILALCRWTSCAKR